MRIFGRRDDTGLIPGTDPARTTKNGATIVMFNGRLEHEPLRVQPGDLVRAYVVNVGPGVAAIHVMGTILETVYDGASEIRPRADLQRAAGQRRDGRVPDF